MLARELILDPGTCTYETLSTQLAYLPRLEKVSLPRTDFSPRELIALEGLYPQIAWDYSVILLGQEVPKSTQELNLSVLTPDQVETAAQMLGLFPELTAVDLMDPYGNSNLSKTDLIPLMEAAPQADVHYTFDLFGTTVSTTDTRLEFIDQPIGNEGEAELRLALAVLKDCEYILLDNCGIDNDILSQIRQDFPETGLVWRVFLGEQSFLTDTTTVRAVQCVDDAACQVLSYCTQLRYLDLSWNADLHNIRFLEHLPELEILLLSGCPITDLTPLANAQKLTVLELAYCSTLEDISPLAGCTALAYLNLSYTSATDMTALHELPLEQFYAVVSKIPWTQQEELAASHPECSFRFDGTQAYGTGWRYRKSGALTDMYARVLEVFGLEHVPN